MLRGCTHTGRETAVSHSDYRKAGTDMVEMIRADGGERAQPSLIMRDDLILRDCTGSSTEASARACQHLGAAEEATAVHGPARAPPRGRRGALRDPPGLRWRVRGGNSSPAFVSRLGRPWASPAGFGFGCPEREQIKSKPSREQLLVGSHFFSADLPPHLVLLLLL